MIEGTSACGRPEPAERREASAREGRFSDALLAARRKASEPAARRGPAAERPAVAREKVARVQQARGVEDEASARTLSATGASRESASVAASDVAALRAIVRALPPTIAAARVREGGPLTLSFGPALGVELRRGADGLEVTLRPAAALERVAAAELPGLVAALRARGLRVARAEVRGREPSGAGAVRQPR